ncbi:MAG: SIS domain-containing protein [Acidimicrobiia bacterium]|nr:SIS domain-containing protein [Acidimicrobiia bacterium]MCY4457568.1 SIS domain-containing protein [Acidimicrobiaceae bacterium]
MNKTHTEIESQPSVWANPQVMQIANQLPGRGTRVGVVGCGTSLFVAQSYAAFREESGHGLTDAFAASVAPVRDWDCLIALSRSGCTTEVLEALRLSNAGKTIALTASAQSPIASVADLVLVASFADEQSVVQTRFATTALTALLASVDYPIDRSLADASNGTARLRHSDADNRKHFVFLGTAWTYGIANEAALKLREMAHCWAESYPAKEYRHGPISVASADTLIWGFGERDESLINDLALIGATVHWPECDPLASLTEVQRLGLRLAVRGEHDPDNPRYLSRSVILKDVDERSNSRSQKSDVWAPARTNP